MPVALRACSIPLEQAHPTVQFRDWFSADSRDREPAAAPLRKSVETGLLDQRAEFGESMGKHQ